MDKPHLLFVLGTRPEAIKCAPVILECQKDPDLHTEVVTTSQHRELQDQVLDLFGVKVNYDLNLMQEKPDLQRLVREAWSGISDILLNHKPNLILSQGDTTSAFIAALAGFYQKVNVAHIEAGLRTYDKSMPFPEEGNRRMISAIADLNFAPTVWAKNNLLKESVSAENIYVVGNSGIDALLQVRDRQIDDKFLESYGINAENKVALVTSHRRENWGENMKMTCGALKELVGRYGDMKIVFLTHPNPEASTIVRNELNGVERISIQHSIDYVKLVALLNRAYFVITDSGGLQEESPSLGKPVLILREKTERPEGVEQGSAVLVGTNPEKILHESKRLIEDSNYYQSFSKPRSPYGDGKASERMRQAIRAYFRMGAPPEEFEG